MVSKIKKYSDDEQLNLNLIVAMRRALQPEERGLSAQLTAYGLTVSQFGVLDALFHLGPLNINQIIEKTLSTSGNMTVVIRNLVKQGLVTKERDPEDGRAFIVHMTERGQEIMAVLFPKHLETLESVFATLEKEDKAELLRLLKKLNKY